MASILNIMRTEAPDDASNSKRLIRDSLVEGLATMIFVFGGTLGAISTGFAVNTSGGYLVDRILPIAICFGISIMSLVYAIGHITGGHMNPGVTFMMYLRRQISAKKAGCYMICQFIGALLGSSLVWGSSSGIQGMLDVTTPPFYLGATTLNESITTGNGFLLEVMGSFFFYFVIAQTALDKRGIAPSMFPAIPIGFILVVVHVGLIPFTGCGVNPARTFGPAMVVCMSGDYCSLVAGDWYWIYFIGPFLASFLVAEVTMLMEMDVDTVATKAVEAAKEDPDDGIEEKA